MKAQFLQDTPGKAVFAITLEGASLSGDGAELIVQRSSDQFFMGEGGMGAWSPKEERVTLPCQRQGDTCTFAMGPEYVNYLEPGNYQIRVLSGGEEVGKARLKIDNVQTQAISGSNAMGVQPGREALSAPAEPAAPAVEPVPEPEPTPPPEEVAMAEPAPAGKSKLPLVGAALLLLCLTGGAFYYFAQQGDDAKLAEQQALAQKEADAAAEAARKAEAEKLAAEAARKAEEESLKAAQERKAAEDAARLEAERQARNAADAAAQAEAQRLAQRADARGRARAFFASADKTPQAAVELTRELDADSDEQKDAIFRLYYYAANEDYVPAYTAYATCLDPTTPQWGTIQKDAATAWDFYKKTGTPEGTAAADKVLAWTRENVTSNAKAREWLQQMK